MHEYIALWVIGKRLHYTAVEIHINCRKYSGVSQVPSTHAQVFTRKWKLFGLVR